MCQSKTEMKAQRFESICQGANSPKTLASKKFSITGFYNNNDSSKKKVEFISSIL